MLLCAGSKFFGAFSLRVDAGSSDLIKSFPARPGNTGRRSRNLVFFVPLRTLSIIGRYPLFDAIKWSKHCATLQRSAEGFQFNFSADKSANDATSSDAMSCALVISLS